MATGGPFPTTNTDSNSYFIVVVPFLDTNSARLSITAGNITILNDYFNNASGVPSELGWRQLWLSYADPDVVNKSIRQLIALRRKQIVTHLRLIYDDIPKSALTVNDRNTLNLPLRDTTPTTVQAVEFAPVISFETVSNGIQIVRFQNPKTPDSNAMPDNQHVELQMYDGAAGIAENEIPFVHFEDTGKHLLKVEFDPTDKGKTAYYRGRYETETGKTGPWSDMASEIIL